MTYKQTMTANRPWFHTGGSSFSPMGIIAWLKNAVKLEIPVGYQDETGFHSGVKADKSEINWPTTW